MAGAVTGDSMSDINYASLHPADLRDAIENADAPTLDLIDADLEREEWGADGVRRRRIAERKAHLAQG